MIKINFTKCDDLITGFECKGHSNSAPSGEDIVCAFVSSACFMTANTVTDILNGLILHLTELEKDYPDNIKVNISEV